MQIILIVGSSRLRCIARLGSLSANKHRWDEAYSTSHGIPAMQKECPWSLQPVLFPKRYTPLGAWRLLGKVNLLALLTNCLLTLSCAGGLAIHGVCLDERWNKPFAISHCPCLCVCVCVWFFFCLPFCFCAPHKGTGTTNTVGGAPQGPTNQVAQGSRWNPNTRALVLLCAPSTSF